MKRQLVVFSMAALALGVPGIPDGARAGDRPDESRTQPEKVEVTWTSGAFRTYGYPEYRCRRFSFECNYYRPGTYGYTWSSRYRFDVYRPVPALFPVRLGRYRVDAQGPTSEAVPRRSGGFVRVAAPGDATRWVAADSLLTDK